MRISLSTVRDRLLNDLGYKCFHSKWFPHLLTADQRKTKVSLAKDMIIILENQKRYHFPNNYTGDESWLLYVITQFSRWVISTENFIEKVAKTTIQKELMEKVIETLISFQKVLNSIIHILLI